MISKIERVSRPGCRVYAGSKEIPRVLGGLGINILTTPKGVMTGIGRPQRRRWRRSALPDLVGGGGKRDVTSRKKADPLPKGVKINIADSLQVEGPKGKLTVPIPAGIKIEQKDGHSGIARESDKLAALHGLTRALAANAVQGVSTGFTRELDIVGTGYRADVKGNVATFTLGYSHPIEVILPKGVDMKVDKQTHVVLTGYDRREVGQVAAQIRALRPPDPYKNKGVRYTGEVLRKKAGKTGAGGK